MPFSHFKKLTIAVVNGELGYLEQIYRCLKKRGFSVYKFSAAGGFMNFLKTKTPDIVVIGTNISDADSVEVCRSLKTTEKFAFVPIILLTRHNETEERILGLEVGVDDCAIENCSPRELFARVKRLLVYKSGGQVVSRRLSIGKDLVVDISRTEVYVNNEKVKLTPTEFRILQILAERKGWVLTRDQILAELTKDRAIWARSVDVHISRLKKKLGKTGKCIKSVKGSGYKIEDI